MGLPFVFYNPITAIINYISPLLAPQATMAVANGGTVDITPTLVRGVGVSYSIVGTPTGATFNTSTGRLSGTLSTPGAYDVEITASNILGSHTIYFRVVVYSNTISINDAWLTNPSNQATVTGVDGYLASPYNAYFLNSGNTRYLLTKNVTTTGTSFYLANANILFDLGGYTITYNSGNANISNDHMNSPHGIAIFTDYWNKELRIPTYQGVSYPTIISGTITNAHSGDLAHGIYGYSPGEAVIERLNITTDGKDSHSVYFNYGGILPYGLRDNVLRTNTTTTFNRHAGPANVFTNGTLRAERNVLIGGNCTFNVSHDAILKNNVMGHHGFVTNGYGAFLYDTTGVLVKDNIIIPINGRGVIADGGRYNTITNNVILHLESGNAEFGTALSPPAFRTRYGSFSNTFSGNTTLGIGGGGYCAAASIYLTTKSFGVNTMINNDSTTILVGTPGNDFYALPVTLEGNGTYPGTLGPAQDIISGNNFKSNHKMVALAGYDGPGQQGRPLEANNWSWASGSTAHTGFMSAINTKLGTLQLTSGVQAAAQTHINQVNTLISGLIYAQDLQASRVFWKVNGWTSSPASGIFADLLNSTFGSGVDPKTHDGDNDNPGSVLARDAFFQSVQVMVSGSPLANKSVLVSSSGYLSTGVTDSNGYAPLTFYRSAVTKAAGGGAFPYTVVTIASSIVSYSGLSGTIAHTGIPAQITLT